MVEINSLVYCKKTFQTNIYLNAFVPEGQHRERYNTSTNGISQIWFLLLIFVSSGYCTLY